MIAVDNTYLMPRRECAFCETTGIAERLISTNDLASAFLSSPRLMPGHTLVIPNRHVELPSELSPEETVAIFELIKLIHTKLLGSIALGVDIWQKSRPQVDQDGHKVDHVHFHILPSSPGEELYDEALNWRRSEFNSLAAEERDRILMLLSPE